MRDGLLLVDKPAGPTSHDIVAVVRRTLQMKRVGHAGTLDPFATGLMVVLVGRATRLCQYMVGLAKRYSGNIRLGQTTDTDDSTGSITGQDDSWRTVDESVLNDSVAKLVGRYLQRPPAYSARRVDGQRAYRLARRGDPVKLESREVEVTRFEVTARQGSDISFRCEVSGGTYIRALARDLGVALGCGAHLSSLRRESVGRFSIDDAVSLAELASGSPICPPIRAVEHLPQLEIDLPTMEKIRHGRPIPDSVEGEGQLALVYQDVLVAVAERRGGIIKPRVVLQ